MQKEQFESIKNYYGKVLSSKNDLKSTACCSGEQIPSYLKHIIEKIHTEVRQKFYGCGVPIPPSLEGLKVLDLGSGSGRDCFLLSNLVGEKGQVIGVDMTDEQLATAKKHIPHHVKEFKQKKTNVDFRKGYIENLKDLDIADQSIDLVVSNCVINLSPAKDKVFKEIFRVLKPGGELYFSDVFSDRRLNQNLRNDDVLLGECLGGAMYTEDFRRMLLSLGCADFRTIAYSPIELTDPDILAKTGPIQFFSHTIRAFKLNLEDRCEDYGQCATYQGSIEHFPHSFYLDDHHLFTAHKPMLVCSNTAKMLSQSRFGKHFSLQGDTSTHFGLFDCAPFGSSQNNSGANPAACC